MKYGLRLDLHVSGPNVAETTERVIEEYAKLEDLTPQLEDFALGLDLGKGLVEVEITVTADEITDALTLGVGTIRAAIHAAGGATPNWDTTTPQEKAVVTYMLDEETGLAARPLVGV